MHAIIFRTRRVGLANRLRALVGYQAMSRLLQVPFYLCWEVDQWCDVAFTDLFHTSNRCLDADEIPNVISSEKAIEYTQADWFHEIFKAHLAESSQWLEFLKHVASCLRELTPNPSIATCVHDFCSRYDLSKLDGFHIRHTDNLHAYSYFQKMPYFEMANVSTLEGFAAEIEKRNSDTSFFLATDDPLMENQFLERHKGRVLVFPKRYSSAALRTSSIQDAVIEMLLLGQCRRIVGTYYSSFSKFAAIWHSTDYAEIRAQSCVRNPFVDRTLEELKCSANREQQDAP